MNIWKRTLVGSFTLTLLVILAPGAKASIFDQKVSTTFTNSVEIPGQMLPAGTYVLKVMNVVGDRDIVQVSNADESHVIAMAFTVARYRSVPTSDPVFVMQERGPDSPQALQAWFYPGFQYGHQFIYTSHVAPAALSAATPAPAPAPAEPTMNENPPAATEESAPVAENNQPEAAPEAQQSTPAPSSNQTQELPKTASDVPLIGLIGALLLGGAVGLKALASRV